MRTPRNFFRDLALQRKLLLVSVLTTGAALLVALLSLVFYDLLVVRPRLVKDLASRMELLSLNLDVDLNFGDRLAARRTLEALRSSPDMQSACLFDAARHPFAQYAPKGKQINCEWPPHLGESGHRFHGNSLIMSAPILYEHETVGYLVVDARLAPLEERLRQYGLVLGVVLLTLFSGTVLYGLLLRKLVTSPLLGLYSVAEQVTREQRYDLRSPPSGHDEVGRLSQVFNEMLSTVEARDAALRRSQSLLQNIVENSSAVIHVKDLDGRYLLLNGSYRAIIPPGAPDPMGRSDAELFEPGTARVMRRNDCEVLSSGKACAFEETIVVANGELRTFLSEKFPLIDDAGHIWALGGVSTDITERKRNEVELMQYRDKLEDLVDVRTRQIAEANRELGESLETIRRAQDELVRSEKLAALGSLVAGVAHELNTPIGNSLLAVSTMIDQTRAFNRGLAEGVKRSTLLTYVDDVQNGSQIVMRNLHRAVDLVSSFKQVAVDRATSQCREFRLRDLASEILLVLMPTFKKSGIHVHQEIPETIVMYSYPGPFGQVLINLVNNGLIHAFEGRSDGEIVITAQLVDADSVEITVRDNGAGIAPENMGRIYDPFFTTKLGRGGSGLGLNIVYNIVYGVLGGKIDVRSELGEGTSFVMTLPLRAA